MGFVPPSIFAGMIVSFEGAIVDIPSGWVLCDGNNGTPDLRNKFCPGAGDLYNPGITSGAINHNHDFTGLGHQHVIGAGNALTADSGFDVLSSETPAAGTTNNANGLPPYYSLAYIMKT